MEELASDLFGGAGKLEESYFKQAESGLLFIEHVELLPQQERKRLFSLIETGRCSGENGDILLKSILVCAIDEGAMPKVLQSFYEHFPVHIRLPSLGQRTMADRL